MENATLIKCFDKALVRSVDSLHALATCRRAACTTRTWHRSWIVRA